MAISEHKSVSVGAGVSILTTIAGIFSSYLRAHPVYLVIGAVVGVTLLFWPFFHSLFVRNRAEEDRPSPMEMKAERDISKSPQFGVVHGDVHFSQTNKPSIQTPKRTAPPAPAVPDFHWSFRYARLRFSDGIWREGAAIGFQAVVADIALPAGAGAHSSPPTVYGAIQIKGSTSKFAKRPYWIDECANEMRYEIGHSATLVVLCFEADIERKTFDWVVYENPVNSIPDHPFWNHPRDLGKRVALAIEQSPDIVISLVDAHNSHVLDRREIRLTVSNSVWNIEELPNKV